MSLRLYNTRTRSVEPFVPLDPSAVRIYVCGLTPSAEAHLGHARSFLTFDVLRRYLVHRGHRVRFVRNVTDIDDRSIAAGIASGVPWREIVDGYDRSFKRSMDRLGVLEPDHEPRATGYVDEMLAMIAALVERRSAYVVRDGVYYSVASFGPYGALSGRRVDELMVGARIAPGEEKRDPLDFALWKFAKPGEPSWPSPWGDGRPGWHIECSAMAHALLGEPFDIHGGGYDLVFPHHENEIAQSEPLYGRPMANVWMHGGLLQFDGKKMSKSLGNFEPLSALLDRHDPQAIRLLFLQTGYRKPMNYTEAAIDGATAGLRRLFAAYDAVRAAPGGSHAGEGDAADRARARFTAALDDDLNTSGAMSVLFELAADAAAAREEPAAVAAMLHESLELLGLSPARRASVHVRSATTTVLTTDAGVGYVIKRVGVEHLSATAAAQLRELLSNLALPDEPADAVDAVVRARLEAKAAKDYTTADRLRAALAEIRVSVADSKEGATWSVEA